MTFGEVTVLQGVNVLIFALWNTIWDLARMTVSLGSTVVDYLGSYLVVNYQIVYCYLTHWKHAY